MKPVLVNRDTRKVALKIIEALKGEKRSRAHLGESANDRARRWILEAELKQIIARA
jgi:DNA topoisomerase IB